MYDFINDRPIKKRNYKDICVDFNLSELFKATFLFFKT